MLWHFLPGWGQLSMLALCLLIFTPLEYLIPAQRGRRLFRPGWTTDLLHFLFTVIPVGLGLSAVIGGSVVLGQLAVPAPARDWVAEQPVWLQVLAGTMLADLFFYFGHRLQHEVPWLWDFHAVHHSSEQLDWLAAFRVHPVDQVIERGTALIPLFALGFSMPAILIAGLIYQWQALVIHSNLRLPAGPLKWLVATPAFHHWHHASEREGHNKNFAGQLPLWDIVFGTAYLPGTMPERYGIAEPMSGNYLMQLLHPFLKLARRLRRRLPGRLAGEGAQAPRP